MTQRKEHKHVGLFVGNDLNFFDGPKKDSVEPLEKNKGLRIFQGNTVSPFEQSKEAEGRAVPRRKVAKA